MPNYYKPWNAATENSFDDSEATTNALASEELGNDSSELATNTEHTSNKEPWVSKKTLKNQL